MFIMAKRESDGWRFPCQVRCDGCLSVDWLLGNIQAMRYEPQLPEGFVEVEWLRGVTRFVGQGRHLCASCRVMGHFVVSKE